MHISYFIDDVQQSVDFIYHYINIIIAIIFPIIYKVFLLEKKPRQIVLTKKKKEEKNIFKRITNDFVSYEDFTQLDTMLKLVKNNVCK